ncbi:rCG42118 [Rattus norvegicus]|uniref:RCG42118 n=1 Tax=Rattus norvegicus TaxID=10116 RepID=A6JUZ5_RAT|nr:rCG42118 [Rattus norvegicus]
MEKKISVVKLCSLWSCVTLSGEEKCRLRREDPEDPGKSRIPDWRIWSHDFYSSILLMTHIYLQTLKDPCILLTKPAWS